MKSVFRTVTPTRPTDIERWVEEQCATHGGCVIPSAWTEQGADGRNRLRLARGISIPFYPGKVTITTDSAAPVFLAPAAGYDVTVPLLTIGRYADETLVATIDATGATDSADTVGITSATTIAPGKYAISLPADDVGVPGASQRGDFHIVNLLASTGTTLNLGPKPTRVSDGLVRHRSDFRPGSRVIQLVGMGGPVTLQGISFDGQVAGTDGTNRAHYCDTLLNIRGASGVNLTDFRSGPRHWRDHAIWLERCEDIELDFTGLTIRNLLNDTGILVSGTDTNYAVTPDNCCGLRARGGRFERIRRMQACRGGCDARMTDMVFAETAQPSVGGWDIHHGFRAANVYVGNMVCENGVTPDPFGNGTWPGCMRNVVIENCRNTWNPGTSPQCVVYGGRNITVRDFDNIILNLNGSTAKGPTFTPNADELLENITFERLRGQVVYFAGRRHTGTHIYRDCTITGGDWYPTFGSNRPGLTIQIEGGVIEHARPLSNFPDRVVDHVGTQNMTMRFLPGANGAVPILRGNLPANPSRGCRIVSASITVTLEGAFVFQTPNTGPLVPYLASTGAYVENGFSFENEVLT